MKIEDILGLAIPVTSLSMYVARRSGGAGVSENRLVGLIGHWIHVVMDDDGRRFAPASAVEWIANHRLLNGEGLGIAGGVSSASSSSS